MARRVARCSNKKQKSFGWEQKQASTVTDFACGPTEVLRFVTEGKTRTDFDRLKEAYGLDHASAEEYHQTLVC